MAEKKSVAARAAECLAEIGRVPADLVPALTRALSDPDDGVRAAAARALGCARGLSPAALASLRAAEEDRCFSVRQAARIALKEPAAGGSLSAGRPGE